jgi:hypothetical protein
MLAFSDLTEVAGGSSTEDLNVQNIVIKYLYISVNLRYSSPSFCVQEEGIYELC